MAETKKDVMDEELKEVNEAAEAETEAAENNQEEETKETEAQGDEAAKEDEAEASGAEENKDKGLFGKKKKKDKKDEQIEDLNDRLRRQMAEFDNFRKRSEKEKSQMFDMGARSIIEKVLPVVDNFERGLAAVPEEQKDDAFVTGMDKIYKQLMTELDAIGVKPIEALGQEFNPDLHNAVMQVESEEYDPGVVAQELQKGYTYKDTVVRHSMVAVVSE
jgi:molecular chaperone GrpE